MKITFTDLEVKIKKIADKTKHPNLLAYATVIFKNSMGDYFSITGFTVWKSKFDNVGLNVEEPGRRNFKYVLAEKSFMEKLKKEILEKYNYAEIPIVEEKETAKIITDCPF
jgi:hypothetical protein